MHYSSIVQCPATAETMVHTVYDALGWTGLACSVTMCTIHMVFIVLYQPHMPALLSCCYYCTLQRIVLSLASQRQGLVYKHSPVLGKELKPF